MPRFSKIEVEEILAQAKNLGKERFLDQLAPETPLQPIVSLHAQMVVVTCKQNTVKATDLAGFEIWRNTTNTSQTATKIGWVTCAPTQDFATWADTTAQPSTTYYYWTIARDLANNASPFSPVSASVTIPAVAGGEIPAPDAPTNISLSTGATIHADGTITSYVRGTFTAGNRAFSTRIEVGEGLTPATWTEISNSTSGSFEHAPVKASTVYSYRLTSVNTGGTAAADPVSITSANNTAIPTTPLKPTTKLLFKSIIVTCQQGTPVITNLAGFEVWRNTTTDSASATKVGFSPCPGSSLSSIFLDETTGYGTEYYYWTKALDTTGNVSALSPISDKVTTTAIIAGDIAAGALASSALFVAGVVDAAALADCAVTAAKTALAAIDRDTGKIARAAIDNPSMFTGRPVDSTVVTTGELLTLSAQIKDAIVTNAKIASLDAGKITTGSLDAGRIAAGSLLGCHIAANTITTSHLLVAAPGAALNEDPAFTDDSAWISCSGARYLCTVTDGKVGTTVVRSRATGGASWPFSKKRIPIDPNKTYRVRVWVRKSATANGLLFVSWRTYDAAGNGISANLGCYVVAGVTPNTTWTEYAVLVGYGTSYPAASNARTMNIGLGLNYGGTDGYAEAQDFRIEEVLPATLIQDGAITTSKILANSICSGHICTGGISGACITAGSITADRLNVGCLEAISSKISGWCIYSNFMCSGTATGYVYLNTEQPSIYTVNRCAANAYSMHGQMYWGNTWQNAYGFSITPNNTGNVVGALGVATNGTVTLPDSSTVAATRPFFWVGDASQYIKYYNGTLSVRGDIVVQDGSITTTKLASGIIGGALNEDPYFCCASNIRQATGSIQCGYALATVTDGIVGNRVLRTNDSWQLLINCRFIPVQAGKQYRISVYLRAVTTGSGIFPASAHFYSTGEESDIDSWNAGYINTTTSWQRYSRLVTVPAGKQFMRIGFHQNSGSKATEYQDLRVEEAVPNDKIASGAIAGLTMTPTALYSSDYVAGTAGKGFCINSAGQAEFNNVTVRGTVCATAGCFTGTINATSGTFRGELSGATGSFCGILLTGRSTYNSSEVSVPVYPTAQCYFWIQAGYYCSSIADYFGCRLAYGKLLISADVFEIYGPFGISNSSSGWGSGISVSALKRSSTKGYTFYFYKNTDRYLYIKVVAPSGSFEPTSQNAYTGTATMTMLQTVDMLGTISLTQPSGTLTLQCTISIT